VAGNEKVRRSYTVSHFAEWPTSTWSVQGFNTVDEVTGKT